MRSLLLGVLAWLIVGVHSSHACQVGHSYRIPTNFELVEFADVIVLARVRATPIPAGPNTPDSVSSSWVRLEPIEYLKGSAPEGLADIAATTWAKPNRSKPVRTHLGVAHPSSFDGGCVRTAYADGAYLVAMYRRTPEGLRLLSFPFARQVEDVDGSTDVWPEAVRTYVRIQAETLRQHWDWRIRQQIAALRAQDTPTARQIAIDLKYYLYLRDGVRARDFTDRDKHELELWGSDGLDVTNSDVKMRLSQTDTKRELAATRRLWRNQLSQGWLNSFGGSGKQHSAPQSPGPAH